MSEKIAYHEAGHAVLSLEFDEPVTGVSLTYDGERVLGLCHHGPITESSFVKVRKTDQDQVAEALHLIGESFPVDRPALEAEAEAVLRRRWSDVEKIARCLFARSIAVGNAVVGISEIRRLLWSTEQWREAYGADFAAGGCEC